MTVEGEAGAVRAARAPSIVSRPQRPGIADIVGGMAAFLGRSMALLTFAMALLLA